jgi:transcriptional regulator with XRE-family HTH domain
MDEARATTIPGDELRARREAYGITQEQVARILRHHRNTIAAWERDPSVDVRRQRLYRAALAQLARNL